MMAHVHLGRGNMSKSFVLGRGRTVANDFSSELGGFTHTHTHTHTHRERERERERERDREIDRETERQRDREIDIHRHTHTPTLSSLACPTHAADG